jgi:hypothetical protein
MRFIILCFSIFLISGCVNREIVQPDKLASDYTKDVLITTNSGKSIRMFSENYKIIRIDSTNYVNGKGTVIQENGQNVSFPFEGQISFSEIVQVETREKTIFYYSPYFIFAGAVAFVALVLLIMNGRGFGG